MFYSKKLTFLLVFNITSSLTHGMETPPMVVHFPGIKCPAPQIHLPPALFTKSLGAAAFGIAAANTILLLAKLHAESGNSNKERCSHNNNASYTGAYGLSAAIAGTGVGLSLAYDNSALTLNIGAFVFSAAGAFALSHWSKS